MCMKNSAITFAFVIAIGICFGVNCSHALCRLVRETSGQHEMTTAFGETTAKLQQRHPPQPSCAIDNDRPAVSRYG